MCIQAAVSLLYCLTLKLISRTVPSSHTWQLQAHLHDRLQHGCWTNRCERGCMSSRRMNDAVCPYITGQSGFCATARIRLPQSNVCGSTWFRPTPNSIESRRTAPKTNWMSTMRKLKCFFFLLVTVRYYSILAYAKGSCVVLGDCTYLFWFV